VVAAGRFNQRTASQNWHTVFNFRARSAGVLPHWNTKEQAGFENRLDVLKAEFLQALRRLLLAQHPQGARQRHRVLRIRSYFSPFLRHNVRNDSCPAAGKGKSAVFHRKTRGVKTGASSSAAMANAVTAEFRPSIDRKKGRFLGLFCR
jgi:hypothetical protein